MSVKNDTVVIKAQKKKKKKSNFEKAISGRLHILLTINRNCIGTPAVSS